MTTEPTLDDQIAEAERNLARAQGFGERSSAEATLDALNAQKLAQAFAHRDTAEQERFRTTVGGALTPDGVNVTPTGSDALLTSQS